MILSTEMGIERHVGFNAGEYTFCNYSATANAEAANLLLVVSTINEIRLINETGDSSVRTESPGMLVIDNAKRIEIERVRPLAVTTAIFTNLLSIWPNHHESGLAERRDRGAKPGRLALGEFPSFSFVGGKCGNGRSSFEILIVSADNNYRCRRVSVATTQREYSCRGFAVCDWRFHDAPCASRVKGVEDARRGPASTEINFFTRKQHTSIDRRNS